MNDTLDYVKNVLESANRIGLATAKAGQEKGYREGLLRAVEIIEDSKRQYLFPFPASQPSHPRGILEHAADAIRAELAKVQP